VKEVKEGKAKETFKSQGKPKYKKFSTKLCGKNFKNVVLDNDVNQAVFFYSKNCFACRKFGQ
jgi:hypothetical protein